VWSVHSVSLSSSTPSPSADFKSGGLASEIESCKVGCSPVGDRKVLVNVEEEEW